MLLLAKDLLTNVDFIVFEASMCCAVYMLFNFRMHGRMEEAAVSESVLGNTALY